MSTETRRMTRKIRLACLSPGRALAVTLAEADRETGCNIDQDGSDAVIGYDDARQPIGIIARAVEGGHASTEAATAAIAALGTVA